MHSPTTPQYELEYEHDNGNKFETVGYGKLTYILQIQLPDHACLGDLSGAMVILCLVEPCQTGGKDARKEPASYSTTLETVAMDLKSVRAVVGRVKRGRRWHIVDRFDDCAMTVFEEVHEGGAANEGDEDE